MHIRKVAFFVPMTGLRFWIHAHAEMTFSASIAVAVIIRSSSGKQNRCVVYVSANFFFAIHKVSPLRPDGLIGYFIISTKVWLLRSFFNC